MKRFVFALSLFMVVGFVSAETSTEVQVQNQNPSIAEPGDTVKAVVVVSNDGDSLGEYDSVEVETVSEIEYTGTTSNYGQAFSLCGGCQTIGTLYFNVEENASSGTYPFDIEIRNSQGLGVVEKSVIEVDGSSNLIFSGNADVKQGEDTPLELKLENTGSDVAKQISATLRHPLIGFNSSKVSFGSLEPGEVRRKSVNLNTDEDINPGPESINSILEYREDGNKVSRNSSISINVLKNTELVISDFESDAEVNSDSRLMIELENVGSGEVEGINSRLSCDGASVIVGESFVGSLESDESVPTVYSISPSREKVTCNVDVKYTGENQRTLEDSLSIDAERGNSILPAVFFTGFLMLLAVFYRKKSSKEE